MSVIYWIFAVFQWVAKYLYELVYLSLRITQWGSTIIFPVCRLAGWDWDWLNELPKSSHLTCGLGVGCWDKFGQTPGLVFLMSLPIEFFDYVEWPDILYLGGKMLVTSEISVGSDWSKQSNKKALYLILRNNLVKFSRGSINTKFTTERKNVQVSYYSKWFSTTFQ